MKTKMMPPQEPDAPALVLGLMSGTSGDGLDMALVRFDTPAGALPDAGTLVAFKTVGYPDRPGSRLDLATNSRCEEEARYWVESLGERLYPFWHDTVQSFLNEQNASPDLLVSHGQTLWHDPPVSLQWDCPARWYEDFGMPVITDLRAADLTAGGQGAPLAPLLHAARFRSCNENVAVLNLGGIGNLTLLQKSEKNSETCNRGFSDYADWCTGISGWDTGPGNALMDAVAVDRLACAYDYEGERAARGQVDQALLTGMMEDPYFALDPPKSTGRDAFGSAYAEAFVLAAEHLADNDVLATAAEITVQSVAADLAQYGVNVQRLVVCGGGAFNRHLLARLAQETGMSVEVDPQGDAAEAWLMALIGWRTFCGRPSSIPGVTGAREAAILGCQTSG